MEHIYKSIWVKWFYNYSIRVLLHLNNDANNNDNYDTFISLSEILIWIYVCSDKKQLKEILKKSKKENLKKRYYLHWKNQGLSYV